MQAHLKKCRLNRQGQTLIGVLVSGILVGIIVVQTLRYTSLANKQQTQYNTTFQMDMIRRGFAQALQNPTAWQNTVADTSNTSLACVRAGTNCAGQGGAFRARDATNALINGYDPLVASSGFTRSGTACNSFSPAGNDACPFRLDFTWQPNCPSSGACINPQIRVTGQWTQTTQTPGRMIAFSPNNYRIDLTIQGNSAAVTCATGQVAIGFDMNTGTPICTAAPATGISRCQVCRFYTPWPGSDGSQCGFTGVACSGWSDAPAWSTPYRDDTDNRAGGCDVYLLIQCM